MTTDLPTILCCEMRQKYYILFEKITCKRKQTQIYLSFRAFFSPHVRKSKTVLDFGFRAVDSGFKLLDSPSLLSGSWIPDSGFLQLYSRFQGPGFRISQAKISRISSHGEIFLYIFSESFTSAQTHPNLFPRGCDPAISNRDACFAGKEY